MERSIALNSLCHDLNSVRRQLCTARTKVVRLGRTRWESAKFGTACTRLVRPSRTTLVRAVHNCRMTEFKSWQRLFKARDLSIFGIPLHSIPESSEKERKRAKEQGEKKKEEEEAKIYGSSSSPFPIFDLVLSCLSLSLYLYFWTEL